LKSRNLSKIFKINQTPDTGSTGAASPSHREDYPPIVGIAMGFKRDLPPSSQTGANRASRAFPTGSNDKPRQLNRQAAGYADRIILLH